MLTLFINSSKSYIRYVFFASHSSDRCTSSFGAIRLENFANGPNASFFAKPIEEAAKLIVSSPSHFEVFKRVLQQRDETGALQAVAIMQQGSFVDLDSTVAPTAARLSIEKKLPLSDSVILDTARQYDATLWTQDAKFKRSRFRRRPPIRSV